MKHIFNIIKKDLSTILIIASSITLSLSCNSDNTENEVPYISFKENKDDRWGITDWEGNIIIENEFNNTPTYVKNGVFIVQNDENLYEMYTAEKNFRKIGKEYKSIILFNDGLAPAVEPKEHIQYINPKGETVFTLEKYKDKNIIAATSFYEDKAVIVTEDKKYGYINKKGEVIIPPIYDYASLFYNNCAFVSKDGEKMFIDDKKRILVKFENKQMPLSLPSEGLFPYNDKEQESYGIKDMNNKDIIKASPKYKWFSGFVNGYSVFYNNNDDCGLINSKGETVIRAKYQDMIMCEDVIIYKDKDKYGLISYSDKTILAPTYNTIIPFQGNNKYTYAYDGDYVVLIDKKGEEINNKAFSEIFFPSNLLIPQNRSFYNLTFYDYNTDIVYSDYIDIDSETQKVMSLITDKGIDIVPYFVKPEEFANLYNKEYTVDDLKNEIKMTTELKGGDNFDLKIDVVFCDDVIVPKYENVWKDSYWGNGYYEKEITGYCYNDIYNNTIDLTISLKNKLYDRTEEFLQSVIKSLENKGYKYSYSRPGEDDIDVYINEELSKGIYIYDNEEHIIRLSFFNAVS